MGSLVGLRPPQFSEDSAWLPTWLQQQDVEHDVINREETPFDQRIEELQFLGQKISKDENASLSSRDGGGYDRCHLFLSEDEGSPVSIAPSTENVVHFHLHLSSDGNSESMPSPPVDPYQTQRPASYHAVLKQPLETSVGLETKTSDCNLGQNASLINGSPSIPANDNVLTRHDEIVNCSQIDDMTEVVELSIAASEAVLIHEIMSGSVSKSFPVSIVLEVASQVKQARLDVWKESFHGGDISEVDYISDLDDLTMADAYEDVGLCVPDPVDLCTHDLSVSQVKDTLDSESGRYDGCMKFESTGKSLDFGKLNLEEVLETDTRLNDNFPSEACNYNGQKKLSNDPPRPLDSISRDFHDDHVMHWSAQENLQVSDSVEVLSYDMGEENYSEAALILSQARTSKDAEKYDKISERTPSIFQSRWLGGWTRTTEVKSSAPRENKKVKIIPEPFVGETSFFSESANVVPDENSFVQNQDKVTIFTTQSSIPSGVLCNKANTETLLSQDITRCSDISVSDPLCSVVPCSISSENISPTPSLYPEVNMPYKRYSTSTTVDATENLPSTTTSQHKLVCAEESTLLGTQSEGLQPAVYRQLTSLRPYSVLLPSPGTILVRDSACNIPLLPQGTKSSMANEEKCYKAAENVAESPILEKGEKNSPLILNHGSRSFFQSFHHLTHDFHGEKNSAVQDGALGLLPSNDLQKVLSSCNNQYNTRVQARKRVHFLDSDTSDPQKKKLQKQEVALKRWYNNIAVKRLRGFDKHSAHGAQQAKRCQTNLFDKDQKRLIFQNMEFLLTGFSYQRRKEFEGLIRKYGGIVLSDIPCPNSQGKRSSRFHHFKLPVILCLKKLQTIKFLYGCATNASVLRVDWLTDSVVAGSLLPPEKYVILPKSSGGSCIRIGSHQSIFCNVGIMLHGRNSFYTRMAKVIKHGGGQVFRTLQGLVNGLDCKKISLGAIVAENESRASRHLKHCAIEQKIPMLSTYWIIKSLHKGKLLPCKENGNSPRLPPIKLPKSPNYVELSEEI